jgi:hypothetical protein
MAICPLPKKPRFHADSFDVAPSRGQMWSQWCYRRLTVLKQALQRLSPAIDPVTWIRIPTPIPELKAANVDLIPPCL